MKKLSKFIASAIFAIGFISGCGGTPEVNPLLEEAKEHYSKVENDSLIVVKAPVALKEAEEELKRSLQLWEDGEDRELVTHHAYLAKQRVAIARETAELNAAQDEVERVEAERQRVLIEARRAEALAAEQRAEEALAQVRQERMEAESARKLAEELARRVDELEAQQTKRGLVLTLGNVLFDFDRASLKSGGIRAVEKLVGFLREYPNRSVMIEGFTDNVGSASYNKELSRRRAEAVQQAMIEEGIDPGRIKVRGYGERFPVANNNTEAGRQNNRRVEVVISDKEGYVPERDV